MIARFTTFKFVQKACLAKTHVGKKQLPFHLCISFSNGILKFQTHVHWCLHNVVSVCNQLLLGLRLSVDWHQVRMKATENKLKCIYTCILTTLWCNYLFPSCISYWFLKFFFITIATFASLKHQTILNLQVTKELASDMTCESYFPNYGWWHSQT